MARQITQRQLRNDSGAIMRDLDRGESFIVTRNGAPVGELRPLHRRQFVPADTVAAAFKNLGRVDYARFRADVDRLLDQDPAPRTKA
jgi:antitoxin (DNA-binding transcriptional repressor) of toxin-antitoxin stability system